MMNEMRKGEHTQPESRNDFIERTADFLNDESQLSRQAGSSILACLDRDVAALRGGAHGFDVVGGADDEAVDGGDGGGEGCAGGGFVGF